MIRNYLKIAIRGLQRRPGYAVLNVLGLAVGMAACLLIGLYVEDELSYDDFHDAADRIMVLGIEAEAFGGANRITPYPLAEVVASDVPGVEQTARTWGKGSPRTVRRETGASEHRLRVLQADSTFFEVFDFPMQRGSAGAVLDAPQQAVLTASAAQSVFGTRAVVGRTLTIDRREGAQTVTISGVAEDVPSTSTIDFDIVVPINDAALSPGQKSSWGALMFYTYARLSPSAAPDNFLASVRAATESALERFPFTVTALPLPDLYLSGFYAADGFRGQRRYAYLFGTIALLILGIAAINYVNLVTAQAERRAREVGVRKTMGARRRQLVGQFLGETALLSGAALIVALALFSAALPGFSTLFATDLSLGTPGHWRALAGLVVFVLLVSVAAGAYPAFVLSGFQPVRVLRGASGSTTSGGGWLRKALVVLQFAVSAALILGTFVIYQQLGYVQSKNLGFDGEQVVTVSLSDASPARQTAIKQEVLGHPSVQAATVGDAVPGGFNVRINQPPESISPEAQTEREEVEIRPAQVDAGYVEALGLRVVAGRTFDPDRATDRTQAYLLNEAAAEAFGWTPEGAVGRPFKFGRDEDAPEGRVIGVVENFHVASLKEEIAPVVLQLDADRFSSSDGVLAARLVPDGIRAGLDHIEAVVGETLPDMSFDYTFLDDRFDAMYRAEKRVAWIFSVFAGLAIFVACLGLFGLAAFAAQRRTKEIGIRKAMGASLMDVVSLLSKEFAVLVVVALVLGTPLAYVGMQRWLQDFAYRVEVGPWAFVGTAVAALAIAGLSVSTHAVRAARTDPATALRTE